MKLILFVLVLVSSFTAVGRGEEPVTPKKTLYFWTKEAANWTVDQLYDQVYAAKSDREMKLAHEMAINSVVLCKLQAAVLARWGKEAEHAYARVVGTDTLDDDEAATERTDGDVATVTFADEPKIPVVHLIRVNGQWKSDIGFLVRDLGDQYDGYLRNYQQSTKLLQATLDNLDAGKFKESADLIAHLKAEFDKLNP